MSIIGFAGKGIGKIGETVINIGKAGYKKAADEAFRETVKKKSGSFFANATGAVGEGVGIGAQMVAGVGNIVEKGFDYNPKKYTNSLFGINLTKPAYGLLVAGGIASGTKDAYNEYNVRQMGMPSGEVVSSTPQINYTRFGEAMGATGDLVFAMNRNRRG